MSDSVNDNYKGTYTDLVFKYRHKFILLSSQTITVTTRVIKCNNSKS